MNQSMYDVFVCIGGCMWYHGRWQRLLGSNWLDLPLCVCKTVCCRKCVFQVHWTLAQWKWAHSATLEHWNVSTVAQWLAHALINPKLPPSCCWRSGSKAGKGQDCRTRKKKKKKKKKIAGQGKKLSSSWILVYTI